jgi:hypothetical protein
MPKKITSEDELAIAIDAKEWQERIAKQVDFSKEYLLLFMWRGSGQDKLSSKVAEEKKKPVVIFEFSPGVTQDCHFHASLFAVSRDVNWQLAPSLKK